MMKVKKNQRALQIKSNCFGHAALRVRGNKLLSPYHYFIIIIIIIIIMRLRALLLVAPVYSVRADDNLLSKVS